MSKKIKYRRESTTMSTQQNSKGYIKVFDKSMDLKKQIDKKNSLREYQNYFNQIRISAKQEKKQINKNQMAIDEQFSKT